MAVERALCPALVARENELTILEDALLDAHRGEGQVVILAGEAGLGKTRLASELQKRATGAGTTVMRGGCSEADLSLPYLPFLEAAGNYLVSADLNQLRAGSARRDASWASSFLSCARMPARATAAIPAARESCGSLRLWSACFGM